MARGKRRETMTTQDLREILIETIRDLRAGNIRTSDARAVGDLAEKILNTADLELRYALTISKLDKDNQGVSPGPLLLTDASKEAE